MTRSHRLLCLCVVTTALSACSPADPDVQIAADKARFPPLSATRPPGSDCSENDSAAIRRGSHPLGPTGGWLATAVVDDARVLDPSVTPSHHGTTATAVLMAHESVIAGYIRVASVGVLQARTYDDIYGTAYGGWSPSRLALRPTAQPVFVALGRSAYGDGGLSQVHEVCWTPEGADTGVIVYSSAFAPRDPPLRTRQVFRAEELGVSGQTYNDQLAVRMLVEVLQDRDITAAIDLVGRSEVLLGALPPAVDAGTGLPIPSRILRAREWADLLAFKLGLGVGEPGFAAAADALAVVVGPRAETRFRFGVERYERMLPLYRWVDARIRGEAIDLPDEARLQRGVMGFDPVAIVRQLGGAAPKHSQAPSVRFWAGVNAYADGDRNRAAIELATWLDSLSNGPPAGFEMGAAVRLLATLREGEVAPR